MKCDQCQMLMINGVPCHETGCPNERKVWRDGEWVRQYACAECGQKYDNVADADACCELQEDNSAMPFAIRLEEAKERGKRAGLAAREAGYGEDWSPLSGEWTGESIPELLGDLIDDNGDEQICDAYEEAALNAFQQETE